MALHNIDRHSADRSNPAPNTHDLSSMTGVPIVNTPRISHGTLSVAYTAPGVVPGTQSGPGGVSSPSANLGQFIQSGVMNCTYNSSAENIFSVPHGLGYAPLAIGVANNSTVSGISDNNTTSIMLPTWWAANIVGGVFQFTQYIQMMADNTNVYVYMVNAAGTSGSFVVTYYLYQQAAQQV